MNAAAQPPECYDVPAGQASRELPLCGNGALDPGEVCDDGNNINWDGCNAFCSAFDAMSAAATLAGGTLPCPAGSRGPVIGGTTSQARFCNLKAVDSGPDGSYVILADGGTLLRFDLFTDALTNSISLLQASIDRTFQDVCSVAVLSPDAAVAFHDCGAQQLYVAMADGSHVQLVADWGSLFQRSGNHKAYYDKKNRRVAVAGTLAHQQQQGVIGVQLANISAFEDFYATASTASLATIPQTIYNVWEGATKIVSFDVSGMEPRAVLLESCPATFRSLQLCYVVYMERPAHMEFLRAYIPESGGLDIEYFSLTTQSLMDNALGHPLVRYGGLLKYTLTGACFQIESQIVTSDGKSPPVITLGNACKRSPRLGVECATPLNNPFITDVMTSPILLPDGLSSTHTHSELSEIFASSCQNTTSAAGPLLYRSVLASAYANTTPVDFAELTGVLDVVYVTPTSVGLISTKRILFRDRTQAGYVRATNLIYCPPSFYGQVGGVCMPCDRATVRSVAWQIQCTANSLFETFTLITSKHILPDDVQHGVCQYTSAKGGQCSTSTSASPQQPYNMEADVLDAREAGVQVPMQQQSLIRCLIASAEARTGKTLFRPHGAEYNIRIISDGQSILSAAANPGFNISSAEQQQCRGSIAKGLGSFLQCAAASATILVGGGSNSRRRRLLQQGQSFLSEHQAASQASSTSISWRTAAPSDQPQPPPKPPAPQPSGDDGGQLPLWSVVLIPALSSCVLLALILCFVFRRRLGPKRR